MIGCCVRDKLPPRPFAQTQTFQIYPQAVKNSGDHLAMYYTSKSVTLLNGDNCVVGQFILAKNTEGNGPNPQVYRVEEILNQVGSANELRSFPDVVLVQRGELGEYAEPYRMPRVKFENNFLLLPISVSR